MLGAGTEDGCVLGAGAVELLLGVGSWFGSGLVLVLVLGVGSVGTPGSVSGRLAIGGAAASELEEDDDGAASGPEYGAG